MENLTSVLAALVCPIAMGLMMVLMHRSQAQPSIAATDDATATPSPEDRLTALQSELAQLGVQQEGIVAQISQLAADAQGMAPNDVAIDSATPQLVTEPSRTQ